MADFDFHPAQPQQALQEQPDVGPCLQSIAPALHQAAPLCLAFAEDFAILDAASQRVQVPHLARRAQRALDLRP